ncbi:enoyl-(Acyl carrier protein) reductase [Hirsutella rhossiliensis]
MRLLNTTSLQLALFQDDEVPPYAILSHTWADNELSFEALTHAAAPANAKGWDKVRCSCAVAASLRFAYIWIDTCCIDKSSSAELSEAINSMFRWYEQADLCIAFLTGVDSVRHAQAPGSAFRACRWFTRGWTLHELIAPAQVLFYGDDWTQLGTRHSLRELIQDMTGVPASILETSDAPRRRRGLDDLSVAYRMSWAAGRTTTRPEDVAYCLLGLFDINMPLLYGEGRAKAFKRLQDEIIRSVDDESLYAWRLRDGNASSSRFCGLLAESPAAFGNYGDMMPMRSRYLSSRSGRTVAVTNRGLCLDLPVTAFPGDASGTVFLAFLDCDMRRQNATSLSLVPAILVQKMAWDNDSDVVRIRPDVLVLCMMSHVVLPDEIAAMTGPNTKLGLPPSGILFDLHLADGDAARRPLHPAPVRVISRSPTWQHFADHSNASSSGDLFEINFDLVTVPSVQELQAPKVFGVLELDLGRRDAGAEATCYCLVVGLEPLAPNPFDTPALYFAPWCAFESRRRIADSRFERVLEPSERQTLVAVAAHRQVSARFDLAMRHARLFYRLMLTAASG